MNKRQRKKRDKRKTSKIGKLLNIYLQLPEKLKEELLQKIEEMSRK